MKLLRVLRLIQLVKLLRLFKIRKMLDLADSAVHVPHVAVQLASLTVKSSCICHLVGCLWIWLASTSEHGSACESGVLRCDPTDPSTTWLKAANLENASIMQQYVASIYWVLATMTTVGYGDITPANNAERAVAVVVMIFGATVFGFILGSIAELSGTNDDYTSTSLAVVKQYCDEQGFNQRMKRSIIRHCEFWYQEMAPCAQEAKILERLPPATRVEVLLYIHKRAISTLSLFGQPLPDWFLAAVVRLLEPQAFNPEETIVGVGERSLQEDIFFIYDGTCEVHRPSKSVGWSTSRSAPQT